MVAKSSIIPDFLKARSPQGLRRLMFLKNMKDGKQYKYFAIQFAEGSWVAWFYRDLDESINGGIEEIMTEKVSNGNR